MSPQEWNNFVIKHGPRSGAFLQSWEWGEFQRALGRRVVRVSTDTAVAQLVEYPIRFGFYGFDLPRGPIGQSDEIVEKAVAEARKTDAVFLHVEPVLSDGNLKVSATSKIQSNVRSRQPQHNQVVPIDRSDEEILSAMHEKTRYNIRLAEKKGVTVESAGGLKAAPTFWKLAMDTARRDRFSTHGRGYYETMLKTTPSELFVASLDGKPLAAALVNFFGTTATYLHGASSSEDRNVMAPYLLHWRVIVESKKRGMTAYDLGGVDEKRWPGVTRFKRGWGGEVVSFPDAIELPLRQYWYKLYRLAKR